MCLLTAKAWIPEEVRGRIWMGRFISMRWSWADKMKH